MKNSRNDIMLLNVTFLLYTPVSVQELAVSDRQRRQAQQERDEIADEMVNSSTGK